MQFYCKKKTFMNQSFQIKSLKRAEKRNTVIRKKGTQICRNRFMTKLLTYLEITFFHKLLIKLQSIDTFYMSYVFICIYQFYKADLLSTDSWCVNINQSKQKMFFYHYFSYYFIRNLKMHVQKNFHCLRLSALH